MNTALSRLLLQNASMGVAVTTAKVSHRGQANLPAELRHRWRMGDGGEVVVIDRLLIEQLLVGHGEPGAELHRTTYWCYRILPSVLDSEGVEWRARTLA